jgi:hypothetical protein
MHTGFSKYVPILLFPAIGVLAGCRDREDGHPTAPTVFGTSAALLTAEPPMATPELVPDRLCPGGSTFGVRIIITIGAGSDIIARRLRFDFTDRDGRHAVPLLFSTLTTSTGSTGSSAFTPIPIPTQGSIPIPGLSSIPIPSSSAIPGEGVQIPAGGSRTVPIFLQFGCGVAAAGTLVVSVDTTDIRGMPFTTNARVRVDG